MAVEDYSENKVLKDMSQDYIQKVASILDDLDDLKMALLQDRKYVVPLNVRLHSLFIKLSGKMYNKEIQKQYKYKQAIAKLRITLTKRFPGSHGEIHTMSVVNPAIYPKYRYLCELREIHLNQILERVGLTAVQQNKQRRIL